MKTHLMPCILAMSLSLGCSYTGFVPLSEPVASAPSTQPIPVYASRDVGQPYVVLGYVFRTSEGHKAGLEPFDEHMYIMSHTSELMAELRQMALAKGADAIVGVELFPLLNGWGQPIGFSVGGLAVKLGAPASHPPAGLEESPPPPAAGTPPVPAPAATPPVAPVPPAAVTPPSAPMPSTAPRPSAAPTSPVEPDDDEPPALP